MPFDFADLAARISESVVLTDTPDYVGSGFFVSPSCSVVTALHLVEVESTNDLHPRVDVHLQSGQVVAYEVEYVVEAKDLAILRPIRPIECQELPLSTSPPRPGQAVMMVGHPDLHDNSGLAAVPSHIINTDSTGFATDFLMVGFATFGSSGGPIVNTDGQVIGMAGGAYAVEQDDEGNWIYLNFLVWGVDVSKHLR